jgi:hypothetical protein
MKTTLTTAATQSITLPALGTVVNAVDANLKAQRALSVTGRPRLPALVVAFASKVVFANVGELQTNFAELETQLDKAIDSYLDGTSAKQRFDGITNAVNVINKYKVDIAHNRNVLARLTTGKYGNTYSTGEIAFVELANKMSTGRISGSVTMERAKDVILSIRDDVKQCLQKSIGLPDVISNTSLYKTTAGAPVAPYNSKDVENLDTLYNAFLSVNVVIPGSLSGGGRKQHGGLLEVPDTLIGALIQREVFPHSVRNIETVVRKLQSQILGADVGERDYAETQLALIEELPAAELGSYYRDDKGHPYTVVDRYIITKEDEATFNGIFNHMEADKSESPPNEVVILWVTIRYLLLLCDIYYGKYERLIDDSGMEYEGGKKKLLSGYTETFNEGIAALYREVDFLRSQVTYLSNTGGVAVAKGVTDAMSRARVDGVPEVYATVLPRIALGAALSSSLRIVRDTLILMYKPYKDKMMKDSVVVNDTDVVIDSISELNPPPIFTATFNPTGFQPAGPQQPYAPSSGPFTFGRGGRRRLYEGLRKRGGEGTPPSV